jgi:oligopeptide/dipeptide ABC transporter ATP-binding protein
LGRCVIHLIEPTSGEIKYRGKSIKNLNNDEMKEFRRNTAIIFQDPFLSLHPRMTIGEIIGEPYVIHRTARGKDKENKVIEWLKNVGLNPYHIYRYPHQFSGGQKQRIGIARAMALNPNFIVADEPVASLDVSVRASIINLMKDLQQKYGITILFISHDIAVVRQICNRIIVMYLGKIVESANVPELFDEPLHPYTQALLSSVPIPEPDVKRERIILEGDVPTPINPPSGCRFHPRCFKRMDICSKIEPEKMEIKKNHVVCCHLYSKQI